jgi:superfamily II DNA or RNA helicase
MVAPKKSSMQKVCAFRASKNVPNVYDRDELVAMAKKQGISDADIKKLKTKKQLCDRLGIEWVGSKGVTKIKASPVMKLKTKISPAKAKPTTKKPKVAPKKKAIVAKKKPPTSSSEIELIFVDDRPCNVAKSKTHPKAYTKVELVKLAVKKLGVTSAEANRKNKDELCADLSNAGVRVSPKKTKVPPPKKASAKKKPAPKKTKSKIPPHKPASPEKTKTPTPPPKKKPKVSPKKSASKTKTPSSKSKCISRSKLPLKEHQIRIVEYLQTHRGVIAAYGVGTGKTLTAVTASQCILDSHPDWKVLVVTPTSLQENFKKEIRAYGADPDDKRYVFMTLQTFANRYADRTLKCDAKTFLIIDEAHNLRGDIATAKRAAAKPKKPKANSKAGAKSKATKRKPKEKSMPRAEAAVSCAKVAGKVLLLTATPVYNNPRDVANLVAIVKGEEPLTKHFFEKMMENQAEKRRYFSCVFSFYENETDSEDYPEKHEQEIKLIMTPEYYKKYMDIEKKNNYLFKEVDPWLFLNGVRMATNALDPCLKCEWAVNKIKEGKKTVMYSSFKAAGIEKIQNMLKGSGIKYLEITGSISQQRRGEIVKEFNDPKGPSVLFITKAGGEGLDLKGVRTVILLESGWNRAAEEQIIGRAVRYKSHAHLPKSERRVDVYHMMIIKPAHERNSQTKGSADEILKEKVLEKKEVNDGFIQYLHDISIESESCGGKKSTKTKELFITTRPQLNVFNPKNATAIMKRFENMSDVSNAVYDEMNGGITLSFSNLDAYLRTRDKVTDVIEDNFEDGVTVENVDIQPDALLYELLIQPCNVINDTANPNLTVYQYEKGTCAVVGSRKHLEDLVSEMNMVMKGMTYTVRSDISLDMCPKFKEGVVFSLMVLPMMIPILKRCCRGRNLIAAVIKTAPSFNQLSKRHQNNVLNEVLHMKGVTQAKYINVDNQDMLLIEGDPKTLNNTDYIGEILRESIADGNVKIKVVLNPSPGTILGNLAHFYQIILEDNRFPRLYIDLGKYNKPPHPDAVADALMYVPGVKSDHRDDNVYDDFYIRYDGDLGVMTSAITDAVRKGMGSEFDVTLTNKLKRADGIMFRYLIIPEETPSKKLYIDLGEYRHIPHLDSLGGKLGKIPGVIDYSVEVEDGYTYLEYTGNLNIETQVITDIIRKEIGDKFNVNLEGGGKYKDGWILQYDIKPKKIPQLLAITRTDGARITQLHSSIIVEFHNKKEMENLFKLILKKHPVLRGRIESNPSEKSIHVALNALNDLLYAFSDIDSLFIN